MNILEFFTQECDDDKSNYQLTDICYKDISLSKRKNNQTGEIKYFFNTDKRFSNGFGFDSKEQCYQAVQKFNLKQVFRNKDLFK